MDACRRPFAKQVSFGINPAILVNVGNGNGMLNIVTNANLGGPLMSDYLLLAG